jgi:spore coat polysaccharide biosynthesis protein SpsF
VKTAAIIQARLGSSRLPAKVLLPLPNGRTVLEEVIHRCKQIEGVDVVVVAIPDSQENDLLLPSCTGADHITRGSETDVLSRYFKAANEVGADVILRVTSDCPLIDPKVCADVLKLRKKFDAEYACNNMPRTFPLGLDCEAFTANALCKAFLKGNDDISREHVGPYMRTYCATANLTASEDRSHLRWTLDTLSDYINIVGIFNDARQHQRAA